MTSTREPLPQLIHAWQVVVAAGLAIAYGAVSASFATISVATQVEDWAEMNAATLLFGADLLIGTTATVVGFALLLRREWARLILAEGAIAVALYEFGRRLGALAAIPTEWRDETIGYYVAMVLAIALVRPLVRSSAAVAYTALLPDVRRNATNG